jgi:CRISPR/Cas system CSM-associated protein Csm2 small subunit
MFGVVCHEKVQRKYGTKNEALIFVFATLQSIDKITSNTQIDRIAKIKQLFSCDMSYHRFTGCSNDSRSIIQ